MFASFTVTLLITLITFTSKQIYQHIKTNQSNAKFNKQKMRYRIWPLIFDYVFHLHKETKIK